MNTQRQTFLYNSRIVKVKFCLAGTDTVLRDSFMPITSYNLFRGNLPYQGGPYDAHLGTTDHSYRCQSCYNNKKACPGHEGHTPLNYPVWNPFGVTDGKKWLRLICFNCGKAIIEDSIIETFPRSHRLDEAAKIARTGAKKCVHCKTTHPTLKKDPIEHLALQAEILEEKRQVDKWTLLPHQAAQIFERIGEDTVIKLGKHPSSHPRNFILQSIKVPPVTIRPDVKKIGGGRSSNDDLTTMLQMIIKKNDVLPPVLPDRIDAKLEKSIWELNNAYYDFVRASGEDAMLSLASRLKGKQGRFRKTQLGKRVRNMCRSTIAGSPRLRNDEVGVPIGFARIIQYEEIVQDYNKKRLLTYVQNGRREYPGATKVIKRGTGIEYDVESRRDILLESGDIVMRDMIDGDPVNFNRQPSLTISNISTHRVKIIHDQNIKTLLLNVNVCPLYNADFDGDAMNLIIVTPIAGRNEILSLSTVAHWLISHSTGSPAIGQTDDGIIGMAELTRSGVAFDKYHAMMLFQHCTLPPDFSDVDATITGRDCISRLLADTPINFTRVPEWYKPNFAQWIKYDPSEIKVKIEQGRLLSGVLDKKSIGKGANGGIYHLIASEYGNDKALETIFNMQQLAIAYIMQFGYTIGVMDLIIGQTAHREIECISADIINESKLITEKLQNGEIIPPIGKTVGEVFEEQSINALSVFDNFTESILRAINHRTNNLYKLVGFGSKGRIENIFNIISSIGQKIINGERIRRRFGFGRTLAYFPRFDESARSRGYINSSFLGGMESDEFMYGAMAARYDFISKVLATSITGEQNRTSIKNLESMLVNNYRWAVKASNIIQFVYGGDYLDPRKLERVKFPTVLISDADFARVYSHPDFPDFFAAMEADRREYRRIFLAIERMNIRDLMGDERRMPCDVERCINDILHTNADAAAPTEALAGMVNMVESACKNLPYVLINCIQERRQTPIPDHIRAAAWLLTMLIRSWLHPNAIVARKLTAAHIALIIGRIRQRYSAALIAPGTAVGVIAAQAFCEPFTQYMLDAQHRSVTGGTSKNTINKSKEILGAKSVDNLTSTSMLIPVLAVYAEDKAKVQEIANNIEVMKLQQFVSTWQIFFEKYGEPIHSKYVAEASIAVEFAKLNPLLKPPGDLVRWCIRFQINKTSLILKNMPLDLIITKLRAEFPECFITYTPENAPIVILRVYMRNTMFRGLIATPDVRAVKDQMLGTTIRGCDGIIGTSVVKMIRNKTLPDGTIARHDGIWGISTNGTNLAGVFSNPHVDSYNVITDAIQETYKILGIEAARQRIISELRGLVESCNYRHLAIYADEMTYTGRPTAIGASGLKTREGSNVLLRVGSAAPVMTLEEAAVNSMEDTISGITAPLLIGATPRLGTTYNSFSINEDFVKKHMKKPDDLVAALFD